MRILFQGNWQRHAGLVSPFLALATTGLFSLSQFYTWDGQQIFIFTRLEMRMEETDEVSASGPRVCGVQAKQSGHAALLELPYLIRPEICLPSISLRYCLPWVSWGVCFMSFLSNSQFNSAGCTFFSSKNSSICFLKQWKLLSFILFCHRQLYDWNGCCMFGVSVSHCEHAACLLTAFCVTCSWAGGNHRCSIPTRSGHCLFILSHCQASSPKESWCLSFTEVKLKWGESRCFTIKNVELWQKRRISLVKDASVSD